MLRLAAAACVGVLLLAGAHAQTQQAPQPADAGETEALHALFDRQWEYSALHNPEGATHRGDLRYNDRLSDASFEAIAQDDAQARQWLAQARTLRRDRLAPSDRVSLDLFISNWQHEVEQQAYTGYRTMMLGALGGLQTDFADLMQASPVRTRLQAEQVLARMAAYPRQVDQNIEWLRRGMALGWVSSRGVLERVVEQIDKQLPPEAQQGPYYAPFRDLSQDIPPDQRAALQAAGRAAIVQQVVPAMRKLRAFIVDEYIKRAPESGAFSSYPDGVRVYEMVVRQQTTTNLSAAQIHAIGVRELASIRGEMEAVMRRAGFTGSFDEFIRFLNTDPKFFHADEASLLAGYRDIAKRIDAELPHLFAELPRAPYGVRAIPAFRGPDSAEYYNGPPIDGTRPGYFNANTAGFRSRPKWRMATLTAHEAVPGHHLQIARATELRDLPKFRSNGGYVAYIEGWAVYAETLGREIGLYEDAYSLFGHLQWRAFRAARLVVDTGIHSLGWPRQRAVDYMVERTGMDRAFVESEVDRYTSQPGQALGYMLGALKIKELRERAALKLGDAFDVRRFHNAVIDQGALPLDVLEKVIDEWIAAELLNKGHGK